MLDAILPVDIKGNQVPIVFRRSLNLPKVQIRLLMVYKPSPHPTSDLSESSDYSWHVAKIKAFFEKRDAFEECYKMDIDQKKKFNKKCQHGEAISISVVTQTGTEDVSIAVVQFKRTSFGTCINFLCTSATKVRKSGYSAQGGFLADFCGMGIAFMLLRAVQLLACCNGACQICISKPNLELICISIVKQ
jgi:hypothetical protein